MMQRATYTPILGLLAVFAVSAILPASPPLPDLANPFSGAKVLSVEALTDAVLARNPTVAQAVAAWEAASARFPQVTALDDPMLGGYVGPASIGSHHVEFAYRVEVSQKIPFPGKRALRGDGARAEAAAAGHDIENVRQQLVESARTAFYDYYLAARALAVNEESLRLLKEFRENALARYRTGQAPEQDYRQAEVEIGRQGERQLTLERMRRVAIARINTLLHLPTYSPLPPPPEMLALADTLPDVRVLQAQAVGARPDLKALADRVAAEQAALMLAVKEQFPDVEVMAAYDAFWQRPEQDLRPQLGVRLNLPVRRERRHAAIAEAQARVAGRQAELTRLTDQVYLEVEEAYQQVRESERAARLYEGTILPAARQNVKAALSAYTTSKVPFLSLLEAQRNLIGLRERSYETLADAFRRRATLARVTGEPLHASAIAPALATIPAPGSTRTAPAGR
jgi:outer membrane protein, heavy metal efflux system